MLLSHVKNLLPGFVFVQDVLNTLLLPQSHNMSSAFSHGCLLLFLGTGVLRKTILQGQYHFPPKPTRAQVFLSIFLEFWSIADILCHMSFSQERGKEKEKKFATSDISVKVNRSGLMCKNWSTSRTKSEKKILGLN